MASHYPGMRLSFNDALCTVRYCGLLHDQKGDWLGVEWDDSDRGRHNGRYKGRRLFEPLSPSPNCASFIRTTRIADKSRSFVEALKYKYAEEGVKETTAETDGSIEISGKVVEEVGFERIRKQQALLRELKIVVLDGLRIHGVDGEAEIAKTQDEIASTCPNIIELDLSRNLFEHWKDIAVICAPLKKLRVLKVSGLRLATFNSIMLDAFRNVEELHLNDCLLKPDPILDMLSVRTDMSQTVMQFPSLKSLSIAGNNLATFYSTTTGSPDITFSTIKTLTMDKNIVTSLVPLCRSLIQLFPTLTTLSIQHNQVSSFNSPNKPSEDQIPVCSSITSLNLSHNSITNPAIISSLPTLLPNLTSLRVSGNPFFTITPSPHASHHNRTEDSSFLLTLARLPNLKTLNYSLITDKDRMDGELYYLSVAEKALLATSKGKLSSGSIRTKQQQDWSRYAELCIKYDRENVVEKLVAQSQSQNQPEQQKQDEKQKQEYSPNSLGARLVRVTFLFSPDNSNNPEEKNNRLTLTIPNTLPIYRVKSLLLRSSVGREWGLRPLGFNFYLLPSVSPSSSHGDEHGGQETEIPDSTRRIGDWIPLDVQDKDMGKGCMIRVVPRMDMDVDMKDGMIGKMDLSRLTIEPSLS